MKKSCHSLALVALGLSLMLLLSACGLGQAFIPQSLDNPLGMGGQALELALGTSSESITVQAGTNDFVGSLTISFANQEIAIPSGLEPVAYSENVSIESRFTLSSVSSDLPAQLTLSSAQLELTVSDESKNINEAFASVSDLGIEFDRANCSPVNTVTTCTYTANVAAIPLLDVSLSGSNFSNLLSILTEGGADNTANLELSLSFDSDNDLPADSQLVVDTTTADGSLKF